MKRFFTNLALPLIFILVAYCMVYAYPSKNQTGSSYKSGLGSRYKNKLQSNVNIGYVTKHLLDFSK